MTEIHFGAGTVQNHQSRSSDFRWSPPISRHSLLVQPKPVLGARPSLPTIARLCSSVTHTKQPCKLFLSSESNTYRLEVQQYFILWNKEEHPDPVFQYLFIKLAFAFFFFFLSLSSYPRRVTVSRYWRRNVMVCQVSWGCYLCRTHSTARPSQKQDGEQSKRIE